jgi:hypothetical protein
MVGQLVPAIGALAIPPRQFVDQYGARVVDAREAIAAAAEALLAAGWRPPLPDSETAEWGYRHESEPDIHMRIMATEERAREFHGARSHEFEGWRLFRRAAPGPWIEVQP